MTAITVSTTPTAQPASRRRLPTRLTRPAWLAVAVSMLALAIVEVGRHDLGVWPIVVFVMAPDLAFLAAIGAKTEPGRLAPRAVSLYNLVHRPVLPLAVIAAASFDVVPVFWFVAGLSWLAHIAIDRVVGYGLRTADGWQR